MEESKKIINSREYKEFLTSLKNRVQQAQVKAAVVVNEQLIMLYWNIGGEICSKLETQKWGSKFIENLAQDLRKAFPEMKGFSIRNLEYMRTFANEYKDPEFVQQVVARIPWGHNCMLLDKLKTPEEREWYARASIENGWSRNILAMQIDSRLYERQGKAITNFQRILPTVQSDLAQQSLKDPYIFDFLNLRQGVKERKVEQALLEHIKEFLLELGSGFAFLGNQYHLEVAGDDYYIDLLFYHIGLRAYVAIELKTGEFKPEYAGKMNFYLSALDDILKRPEDNPSIGLILCRSHNKLKVEYSLKDTNKPLGVASYELTKALPEQLQKALPSIEELEQELLEVDEEL